MSTLSTPLELGVIEYHRSRFSPLAQAELKPGAAKVVSKAMVSPPQLASEKAWEQKSFPGEQETLTCPLPIASLKPPSWIR